VLRQRNKPLFPWLRSLGVSKSNNQRLITTLHSINCQKRTPTNSRNKKMPKMKTILTLIIYVPLRAFIAASAESLLENLTNPQPSQFSQLSVTRITLSWECRKGNWHLTQYWIFNISLKLEASPLMPIQLWHSCLLQPWVTKFEYRSQHSLGLVNGLDPAPIPNTLSGPLSISQEREQKGKGLIL